MIRTPLSGRVNESGQALLLVLLAMAAILTVVLSVATRSVTDVSVTSSEEDALRAFSAAEAGVEKALLNGSSSSSPVQVDTSDPSVTYTSNVTVADAGGSFAYPGQLKAGEIATFWMVSHDTSGNLTCSGGLPCYSGGPGKPVRICWGDGPTQPPSADIPAVEVSVYYDSSLNSIAASPNYSGVKVAKFAFDRNSSRAGGNGFDSSGIGLNTTACKINGKQYLYQSPNVTSGVCSSTGCVLMIRVRMFYNPSPQSIAATVNGSLFPAQGNRIESTGVAGESTRKVNVFQSFSEAPTIFDAAVFSLSDFAKP